MAIYYVSKAGNDSNAGTDAGAPKLTVDSAVAAAGSNGDIVEIIDEGTYAEGNMWNRASITVRHTASHLGRPVIDGTGGPGGTNNAFWCYNDGYTIIGLEIKGQTGYVFKGPSATALTRDLAVSGCFIHDVTMLGSGLLANTDSNNPITFDQCVMFFEPGSDDAIITSGYTEISNCLITASNLTAGNSIIYDSGNNCTASFCTIIDRGGSATNPTVMCSKVINSIVYSNASDGIASDDQTYNLVSVPGSAFRNKADDALAATGSNYVGSLSQLGFIDNTSIGSTISVAANYNLQASSLAIDAGTSYDSIVVDITGTIRPQNGSFDIGAFEYVSSDPDWTEYTTEPEKKWTSAFTINTMKNRSADYKYKYSSSNRQAPFSTAGPTKIRGSKTPYKATK
jgi:hypothetical protein